MQGHFKPPALHVSKPGQSLLKNEEEHNRHYFNSISGPVFCSLTQINKIIQQLAVNSSIFKNLKVQSPSLSLDLKDFISF